MINRIKCMIVMLVLVLLGCTGCGKEEKHLDFDEIASIKVVLPNETEERSVFDREKVKELLLQIEDITWEKAEEEYDEDYIGWEYKITCYDAKGQKKINMILCDETKMIYKNVVWNASDAKVDLTSFEALFQE